MEVLLWTLGIVATALAFWAIVIALAVRGLRRRNRVVPDVASTAPLRWLTSPGKGARLHRRLRAAIATTRSAARRDRDAGSTEGAVAAIAAGLQRHAAALDRHIVVAAAAPRSQRRELLGALRPQVDQLEQLSARLARHVATTEVEVPRLAHHPLPLDDLEERLDALEDAREEVALAEVAAGLSPARREPLS